MIHKVINTIRFLIVPSNFQVLVGKIFEKIREIGHDESKAALQWACKVEIPLDQWLQDIKKDLYEETVEAIEGIREQSQETVNDLRSAGVDLGGGGAIDLLYFLTRLIGPNRVLETGVAAGWSSYAFLLAIEKNRKGMLLSSDLPYFRIKNPEKYIGILVPDKFRTDNWHLEIKGDEFNLPKLLAHSKDLEIVHYDSDKRKAARSDFLEKISKFIAKDSIIIMDDIQNNLGFKEYVINEKHHYFVIKSEEKYVGVILMGKYCKLIHM